MSERDMQMLLDLVEKHLGTEWQGVVDFLRQQNGLDDIEARLHAGDTRGVLQAIDDAALKFAAETHAVYVHAAQSEAAWLNSRLPSSLVRFDVNNAAAVEAARQNQFEWVTGLRAESRAVVHQVIIDGHERGANPREVARDIRDSIGLTEQGAAAVRSYRAALEDQDYSNALDRKLSSGHSDRTIAAAQRAEREIAKPQIDLAVERYRQSMTVARAETIARTEMLKNVHGGASAAIDQAISRGDIDADQLEKTWHHALRGRYSRPDHEAADNQVVSYADTFDIGGVSMRYPGDPAAPADQVINCRCTFSTRLALD